MDRETIKIVKKFANEIKKKYDIKKIILFGSRARGDNFITSDYDSVIVSKDFEGVHFLKRMSDIYRYWNNKNDIEPLCYTPKEFIKKGEEIGIVRQAIKEGIEI
ncbi:MAG: nucleotidyltransferase domain-containing protein [Candidatus Aenigmarchaeota archaeon]|nr:nucleotidyltransferase domain-containing protein [Candidatus Aenigmarchaeota archaeon]